MTVQEIADEIRKHNEENPNHGAGCACMDVYVHKLRAVLEPIKSAPLWSDRDPLQINLARRFDHVLALTVRSLSNY